MTPAHPATQRDAGDAQLHARRSGLLDARPRSTLFARQEHLARTASTNDVVAAWLDEGEPEVCFATADEQTHGRGREGRSWLAPAGSSLLLSLGFRPVWLTPDRTWQLAAVIPLAMADAAEEVAGLANGAIRLKWPNDLVIEDERQPPLPAASQAAPDSTASADSHGVPRQPAIRKLAGVLGETSGLGTGDPRAVIGIGINVDWRRDEFPASLADAMTSLRDASGGRPVHRGAVLDAFLGRLEARVEDLRNGHFALQDWQKRQVTTGRLVDLIHHDDRRVTVRALGVDSQSGGLVVQEDGRERVVHSAEILHVRLANHTLPNPAPAGRAPSETPSAGRGV